MPGTGRDHLQFFFFFLNHTLGPVPKQIKTEWDWVSWGNDRTSPAETALPLPAERRSVRTGRSGEGGGGELSFQLIQLPIHLTDIY